MMEAVVNKRIDTYLIAQVNAMAKRTGSGGGNPASKYVHHISQVLDLLTLVRFFKRAKLDYPQADTSRASRRFVKAMKRLEVSNISEQTQH